MAFSEGPVIVSRIAGSTFSTGQLYRGVVLNGSGEVIVPGSTNVPNPFGVLYSVTETTAGSGVEALSIAVGGIVKLEMAGSTEAVGSVVGFSSIGLGILGGTTDTATFGQVVSGTSGTTGRIFSVHVDRL